MMRPVSVLLVATIVTLFGGCGEHKTPSTTSGAITVECDESVYPVVKRIADDFHKSYKDANITLRSVQGREAIADFINDSIDVIVTGRAFNEEEKKVIADAHIEMLEYNVALGAIVVIGHRNNPIQELRVSLLDSIYAGYVSRWPFGKESLINAAVADINSSTNEVFRNLVMADAPFTPTVTWFPSSDKLVNFVKGDPDAIGIVGLAWLKGREDSLTVFALGNPKGRPDSTQPYGRYYSPVQANVYRHYYSLWRPVYMYSRIIGYNVGVGFISYASSVQGQQIFLDNGLVPATMPVRLVDLTSHQVKEE